MNHLFVTDLDGTLLGADSRISPLSVRILNELAAAGVAVTAATARTPATVEPIFAAVTPGVPLVVMTGGAMWDRHTRAYARCHPIPAGDDRRILEAIRGCGVEPLIYTFSPSDSGILHVYYRTPLSPDTAEFVRQRAGTPLKEFHADTDAPVDAQVMLYFATGQRDKVFAAADRLRAIGGCSVSAFTDIFGPDTGILEVFAPGVDKASAILDLKRSLGADKLTVYGDNLNDLPMMAVADEAVAVGNALPEVKAAAHRVIGPNTADAVARDIAARYPQIITPDILM